MHERGNPVPSRDGSDAASEVSDLELEHGWFAYGDRPRPPGRSSLPPALPRSSRPPAPAFDDPMIDAWLLDAGD